MIQLDDCQVERFHYRCKIIKARNKVDVDRQREIEKATAKLEDRISNKYESDVKY